MLNVLNGFRCIMQDLNFDYIWFNNKTYIVGIICLGNKWSSWKHRSAQISQQTHPSSIENSNQLSPTQGNATSDPFDRNHCLFHNGAHRTNCQEIINFNWLITKLFILKRLSLSHIHTQTSSWTTTQQLFSAIKLDGPKWVIEISPCWQPFPLLMMATERGVGAKLSVAQNAQSCVGWFFAPHSQLATRHILPGPNPTLLNLPAPLANFGRARALWIGITCNLSSSVAVRWLAGLRMICCSRNWTAQRNAAKTVAATRVRTPGASSSINTLIRTQCSHPARLPIVVCAVAFD